MTFKLSKIIGDIACCGLKIKGTESGTATGLYDETTGQPIYAIYDEQTGDVIELYYFDPVTGAKIVTNTGFTPSQDRDVSTDTVYETLSNGAVEKLSRTITTIDGVEDPAVYVQFGTRVAYTPVDLTRVEPRPIKVQMAESTVTVTDAVFDFSAVVGPVTVANSEGENFPQHGLFHVNADQNSVGAGVAYTTDGSDPANSPTAVELEVQAGQSFELDTFEEITNLRMVAIDRRGDADATTATSIEVSYELNNIDETKDDV